MRVTMFRGAEFVESADQLLMQPADTDIPFADASGVLEGKLQVRAAHREKPTWFDFAQSLSALPLGNISMNSGAAVAVFRTEQGWFLFTFGYGRALLNLENIQPGFGLRVVLNSVNAETLASMDVRTYEGTKFQKRLQPATNADLDEFGLDTRRDFVKAVTGRAQRDGLSGILTGRDSLSLSIDPAVDLGKLCETLDRAHKAEKYKERFGWIDALVPVVSIELRDRLDAAVVDLIRSNDLANVDLAPPDMVDYESIRGFRYEGLTRSDELEDGLDISVYIKYLGDPKAVTLPLLKSKHVQLYGESDRMERQWSLYRCLVADISIQDHNYVLSEGQWFEVDGDFLAILATELRELVPESNVLFPDYRDCENEAEYNALVVGQIDDSLLQDQKLVSITGTKGSVEPCDVLTKQKQLIHIKRKTRSSNLSHLFSQGRVSGTLLMDSKQFRAAWRKKLRTADPSFEDVIPTVKPGRDEYEIIFGVTTPKPTDLLSSLPFFSRLNLRQAATELIRNGLKVSHKGILELPTRKQK